MYFCVADPAANSPSFLACATSLRSSANGPSISSPMLGPDKTSSISFLIAGISASCPLIACIRPSLVDFVEPGIHHANRAIHQRLAHIDQRRHIRDLFSDQPEVADNFPERLALLRIANRIFKRHPCPAYAHRAQLESPNVQN